MAFRPFYVANGLQIGNFFFANTSSLSYGNLVANSTHIVYGNSTSRALTNTSMLSVGNDSVYSFMNQNAVGFATAYLHAGGLFSGNSTQNVSFTPGGIFFGGAASYSNNGWIAGAFSTNNFSNALGSFGSLQATLFTNRKVEVLVQNTSNGKCEVGVYANATEFSRLVTWGFEANGAVPLFANTTGGYKFGGLTGNATHATVGNLTITGSVVLPSGDLNIGAANGTSLGIGTTNPGVTGRIVATENVYAFYSDKRLKKDFQVITDALKKLDRIGGYTFFQNELAESFGYNDPAQQVGVIAQEVQAVLPHAVHLAPFDMDADGSSKSGENYLTVQYDKLVPLLIEAVKELNRKVEYLEHRVHRLEGGDDR